MRGKVLCLGVVCAENENDPLASGFCLLASKKCPGGVSQRGNPARAIATPDHRPTKSRECLFVSGGWAVSGERGVYKL